METSCILDYLDSLVPADRAMFPARRAGPASGRYGRRARERAGRQGASVCFTKSGCTRRRPRFGSTGVVRRYPTLSRVLEADRAGRRGDYWFGDRIGHADIAVAVTLRFLADVHPELISMADFPALGRHAAALEALPASRRSANRLCRRRDQARCHVHPIIPKGAANAEDLWPGEFDQCPQSALDGG